MHYIEFYIRIIRKFTSLFQHLCLSVHASYTEFICTILKICYGSTPVFNHTVEALVQPTMLLRPWLIEPELFYGWSNWNIFLLVQIRFSNQGSLLFEAPKPDLFPVFAIQRYSWLTKHNSWLKRPDFLLLKTYFSTRFFCCMRNTFIHIFPAEATQPGACN